jgi:hypothetical protein
MAGAKRGVAVLVVAWGLLGFFNAVALGLFLWTGAALNARSDEFAALSFASVLAAWVGDLVAIVLACVGAWTGRARASAILSGVLAIVIALGSAVVAPVAVLGRFVAAMPVPIH